MQDTTIYTTDTLVQQADNLICDMDRAYCYGWGDVDAPTFIDYVDVVSAVLHIEADVAAHLVERLT
jgi:hypothetical protein